MSNNWNFLKINIEKQKLLSKELGLDKIIAQVLINRGINSPEQAHNFLYPNIKNIPDPFNLPNMKQATNRILKAITNNEKIAIYGDYDVDGLTSTAILKYFFDSINYKNIITYIPNRLIDGYGLHITSIKELKEKNISLIITVDCGTNSKQEINFANNNQIDVIITDHHEPSKNIANAIIVNPKIEENSKYKDLAGCGIAYLLSLALKEELSINTNDSKSEHLDLVALGTIADVASLINTNRIFVKLGFEQLLCTKKPGLKHLISVSGIKDNKIGAEHIAFRLAPRINAAGRLGMAIKSLELLTTKDDLKAENLALELNGFNTERQKVEKHVCDHAKKIINQNELYKKSAIVVGSENWHQGVLGIVASKLANQYNVPSIVLSINGSKIKGSARSIPGFNIVNALHACSDNLIFFGGHAAAAGLTLNQNMFDSFYQNFDLTCKELIPKYKKPYLNIDYVMQPEDLNLKLIEQMALLEPFGESNSEPVLCMKNLNVTTARIVGKNHLKMTLTNHDYLYKLDAIGFSMGDNITQNGSKITAAFVPQTNTWNGLTSIQLKLKDFICLK